MANVIKLKRGTSTPTTSDIVDGEVAIDKSAKKFYINDGGTIKEIGGGSGSGGGGLSSDAQQNTVGGTNAGDSFSGTDAADNTLIGFNAGTAITTGDFNQALGSEALLSLTSGVRNIGLGYRSLKSITTTSNNIGVGHGALQYGSGYEYTMAFGSAAGEFQTGNHNIFMGNFTGRPATGNNNVAIGKNAFSPFGSGVSGSDNVAIGTDAAGAITSGSDNTILGPDAGDALTEGSNNIIIGHNAAASSATVNNEITLGDTNITKFRLPGLNFIVKDSGSSLTEGHVLTLDSNGEASFAAASGGGGGGSWNLISTTTVSSSVSSVDFTSIGSYNRYVLLWDCEMDGNNIPKIQIYDNGSLLTSSNYVMMRSEFSSSGTTTIQTSFSGWITTDSLKSQIGMFEISVAAPRATVSCTVRGLKDSSNNGGILFFGGGLKTSYSLTDIDGFRFTTTAGTAVIDSGRFSLYGIGQ